MHGTSAMAPPLPAPILPKSVISSSPTLRGGDPYTVTLTVTNGTDSDGDEGELTVYDQPPEVVAGNGQTVYAGVSVSFAGTVTDAGGDEFIDAIQWDFDYNGSTFNADVSADDDLT